MTGPLRPPAAPPGGIPQPSPAAGRRTRPAWAVLTALLVSTLLATGRDAFAGAQSGGIPPWRIERDARRFEIVATDNVMAALALRPGMTVLDLGAGTGQFALEFARRLSGTGQVYATDVQDDCVRHIREEAARRGLSNIQSVLVRKDGLDPFYGRQRYDLIAVFHLAVDYEDRVDYFRELRGSLADGGRLALILYKTPGPFSPADFAHDVRGLAKALLEEPTGSPYRRILSDSTRNIIRDGDPAGKPSAGLAAAISADLNRTLSDGRFTAYFHRGSTFRGEARFSPAEARYADWLLLPYRDNAVLNRDPGPQSAIAAARCAAVNKLLIVQRYRDFLKSGGTFESGFSPGVRAAFERAGYRVAREYADLIPFEDLVILESSPVPRAGSVPQAAGVPDWRASREAGHFRNVATERFMDVLALRPGMTVLDIGTGTGQFALDFARRLAGTGRVFATDIDNDCVRRVEEEAKRRGLANVHPVLVSPKGLDPFYARQKYDLVTVIHVPIPDRTAYFAGLRDSMAEGARLVVVTYKDAEPFAPEDIAGRLPELVRELSREPAGSPFSDGLRESTRRMLARRDAATAGGRALRDALLEDFNRMLSDTRFGQRFVEGGAIRDDVAFTPAEKSFADYLLVILVEEKVFEKSPPARSAGDRRPVLPDREARIARRFNKLLFLQRFRGQLDPERMFTPGRDPKMRDDFRRAGYRLDAERRDVMPFEDVLVFRPDRKAGAGRGAE